MTNPPTSSVRPGRVLLAAEDSAAQRFVLSRIMAEIGRDRPVPIGLRLVTNGVELLDYLAAGDDDQDEDHPRPDLILLDLLMPEMGGMETLQRLRSDDRFRTIPVVIMSSSDTPAHVEEAYTSGANAFLVKQGSHAALLGQMRTFSAFWLEAAKLPGPQAAARRSSPFGTP